MFDNFSIYCINLLRRSDRWEEVQKEFRKLDLKVERIFGTDLQSDPVMGCRISHKAALRCANLQGKHTLIFEDDVQFINDYQTIIPEALKQLPKDWCMFYLGGNICNRITRVSSHLGKLSHAQSAHAYCVNKNFIPTLLDEIASSEWNPIDVIYANRIVPTYPCYITIPMVAVQRVDFSDIERTRVNYADWMERRFYEQLGD